MSSSIKIRGSAMLVGLAFAVIVGPLAGCTMGGEAHMNRHRVQLEASTYDMTYKTVSVEGQEVRDIGDHYRHYGDGPVELVITYDPKSKTNTAMKATNETARISGDLRKAGIKEIASSIMPVNAQGEESSALISYKIVTAHQPQGCESMGGLEGEKTEIKKDYGYGCTIEMQLARQIARPKDLSGRSGLDEGSGRRQANIVEVYKTGTPNAILQGELASE